MGTTMPASKAPDWGPWFRADLALLKTAEPVTYLDVALSPVSNLSLYTGKLALSLHHSVGPDVEAVPTDLLSYQAAVHRVIDQYHPTLIVVGNEVGAQWRYPIDAWIPMARVAAAVCQSRGVLIGGAASLHAHICSAVYYDLAATNPTAAQDFAHRCGAASITVEGAVKGNEEIDACKAAGITYAFHSYTNDATTLGQVIDYARLRSGADVWCNELGFRTTSADTTTGPALADLVRTKGLPLALWYGSGQGEHLPTPLWLDDGTPTPAGQAILDRT
jgi:hypothetical protein